MNDRTRLEPTASLVMLWARDLYCTGSAARFYSLLDLSQGEPMWRECDLACPWYDQVLTNRKWCIRYLAEEFIRSAGDSCQVILPAAGKAPLALELLDACDNSISSVIEIDIRGMAEKENLYRKAAPEHAEKIRCVTSDLFDLQGTLGAIRATGLYDPEIPTCVIPEGISYYISPELLAAIIAPFSTPDGKNHIIFDYLLPCHVVNEDRRKYPRGIWRVINRNCNESGTVTYTTSELEETLRRAGCSRVDHHPMHDIERQRTGTNEYFPSVPDGWIQIAEGWL